MNSADEVQININEIKYSYVDPLLITNTIINDSQPSKDYENLISQLECEHPHIKKYKAIINLKNCWEYHTNNLYIPTCEICLDSRLFKDDEIFLCDICYASTHQSCYGTDLHPSYEKEQWLCNRCKELLAKSLSPETFQCFLCPRGSFKGLLKKIENDAQHRWAHVDCVNWIPEIYFEDKYTKEKINISRLNTDRNKDLICSICRKSDGMCIQCDYQSCMEGFHVQCAKNMNLIEMWEVMESYKQKIEDTYIPVYCESHKNLVKQQLSLKNYHKFLGSKRHHEKMDLFRFDNKDDIYVEIVQDEKFKYIPDFDVTPEKSRLIFNIHKMHKKNLVIDLRESRKDLNRHSKKEKQPTQMPITHSTTNLNKNSQSPTKNITEEYNNINKNAVKNKMYMVRTDLAKILNIKCPITFDSFFKHIVSYCDDNNLSNIFNSEKYLSIFPISVLNEIIKERTVTESELKEKLLNVYGKVLEEMNFPKENHISFTQSESIEKKSPAKNKANTAQAQPNSKAEDNQNLKLTIFTNEKINHRTFFRKDPKLKQIKFSSAKIKK